MNIRQTIFYNYLLLSSLGCFAFNIFDYLGQVYRKNLIQFHEDVLFGNKPLLDEYDFIVVGAGPAGATVARRLAEVPEWNILLLEAGGEESLITAIPSIAHYLQFTDYNWGYHSEKEPHACKGNTRKQICACPSGKGLGGTTIINNNIYTRGHTKDFDRWAKAGNPGWSYEDVLPYFLKMEDVKIPELARSHYYGVGGRIPISYTPYKTKLLDVFLKSASDIGIPVGDYNAPVSRTVFSRVQGTIMNGRRITAAAAYLRDNIDNLHIIEFGYVTKILIDENTKTAYGVEFIKNNKKRRILAKKEVIISAGSFNSPKLLMLSGVGPREHLESLGIKTINDLRVGDNLQEHPGFSGFGFVINETISLKVDRFYRNIIKELINATVGNTAFSLLPVEGISYIKTKYNTDVDDFPDIEFLFIASSLTGESGLGGNLLFRTMEVSNIIYNNVFNGTIENDAWTIWPMLMYPESRGQVRLRSTNPFDEPVINLNLFSESIDIKKIVEGIKMIIEISKTKSFQRYDSKLQHNPMPGCKNLEFGTDQYWTCCVETMTTQFHHQSGTCKMGPDWDRNAVVNPQLMVYGINKLRVIDCSIMPTIVGGHTAAPAYMIAEKGADLIKSFWLKT